MNLYAEFHGAWSEYHQSYTWQSLGAAAAQCGVEIPSNLHSAAADAELTRLVLEYVAGKAW